MAYTPTPESELTEQEVRQGFNNLRKLYQEAMQRIHEMKVERGQKNARICDLERENSSLKKENKYLKEKKERELIRENKTEFTDFKKKFFDSL